MYQVFPKCFIKETILFPLSILGSVVKYSVHFSSVAQCVRLFATPWIAARQASLSITDSRSSFRLMSIESVMPSSHLILCRLLLLLPPIPPSIRVFSNESTLRMIWPKYWSFSFSISPSKEIPGLISLVGCIYQGLFLSSFLILFSDMCLFLCWYQTFDYFSLVVWIAMQAAWVRSLGWEDPLE